MIKRLVASATALSLFVLPATPVMAHSSRAAHGVSAPISAELDALQAELVMPTAEALLLEQGYDVGIHSPFAREAVTRVFGDDILADSLAVTLPVAAGAQALVLLPMRRGIDFDEGIPLVVYSDDGRFGAYVLDLDDDHLTISRPDGDILVDAPFNEQYGIQSIDLDSLKIFAFDLPLDFSLDGLISALQGVLDLLYTVKSLINSIICAVQGAVDLLYGLENCGVGTTTIGGGELAGRIQCSAPKVANFINSLQNYCF